jgi:hypothetical protein
VVMLFEEIEVFVLLSASVSASMKDEGIMSEEVLFGFKVVEFVKLFWEAGSESVLFDGEVVKFVTAFFDASGVSSANAAGKSSSEIMGTISWLDIPCSDFSTVLSVTSIAC